MHAFPYTRIIPVFSLLFLFFCNLPAWAASTAKSPPAAERELAMHFIDVGQGDAIFISLPNGENMLIDTGSASEGPRLAAYLTSRGVRRIDHLILTHPDDDHTGGIFNILATVEVKNFYDNGFSNFRSTIYPDYVRLVRKDLSRYQILQADRRLTFSDVAIEVLNPLLPPTGNANNDSIVLKIMYGEVKILLTGDLGHIGERRLLDVGADMEAQILKVGHHGEKDSCSPEFLQHVRAEVAIISVGSVNIYARPHPEVLTRLEKSRMEVYRTDHRGTITVRTDGRGYRIKTNRS